MAFLYNMKNADYTNSYILSSALVPRITHCGLISHEKSLVAEL